MKKLFWTLGTILFIAIGVYIFNYVALSQPTMSKINEDNRNKGISFDVHYKFYILFNTLVFNLKNVPVDKATADVFRLFLQTSSTLKNKEFKSVELSYKGITKFVINGDYFEQLGREYGEQNPIYTMRTFSENLYKTNGEVAYSKWEGGLLGVFSKQMDDFTDFSKKWYLDELTTDIQK